ncbi:MAG: type VI secretion system accessory protein TagJ [Steroidobacteraceae bacterium]
MDAQEAVRAGDLDGAMTQLRGEVRKRPADARLRIFLFQLLCVRGEWNRALTQLNVAGDLDAGALLMVQTYREALRCEVYRAEVFAGKRMPMALGEPDSWFAPLLQSLSVAAEGRAADAATLRQTAYDEAPAITGKLNGEAFEWIADGDARMGPCLELIISGRYYWVPFHRIHSIVMEAPSDLRDFVWMPAQLTWANGGECVALLPSRYPGSEAAAADPALRLARRTDWLEQSEGAYFGLGQRVFITDGGECGLLDARRIELNNLIDNQPAVA